MPALDVQENDDMKIVANACVNGDDLFWYEKHYRELGVQGLAPYQGLNRVKWYGEINHLQYTCAWILERDMQEVLIH